MTNDYGNLELHTVLLSAMKDIDKICRENGLRYYLHAGTLLGAMNHKGFIPWDDDVDISMMREDYEEFSKIVLEQYSESYFFDNYHTDPFYRNNRAVLRVLGTQLKKQHESETGIRKEIGVDIVPIDAAPDSKIRRSIQKYVIWTLDYAVQIKYQDIVPQSLAMKGISVLSRLNRERLGKLIDRVSTKYNTSETKDVGLLTYNWKSPYNGRNGYDDNLLPRSHYLTPVEVPFEDTIFMTISNPEIDLDRRYPNWREPYPEEKRVTKHDVKSYYISDEVRKRVGL